MRTRIISLHAGLSTFVCALLVMPQTTVAQGISFEGDRPRTMVFIQEEGRGQVSSFEMTSFLLDAGFPIIDPALAIDEAAQALVAAALNGNDAAATRLGQDWGAQVLILGIADYATRPDPVDGTLITATAEVRVRVLRLDHGDIVATAAQSGRALEVTDQAAKAKVIREVTQRVVAEFVGPVINDWADREWSETAYWRPDPGSIKQSTEQTAQAAGGGEAPGVGVLHVEVKAASGTATRGIGVIRKGSGLSGVTNVVELVGVVVGNTRDVQVNGAPALLEPLDAEEAARLGLSPANARKFRREFTLPISQDSVLIVASGRGGATTLAYAAPRIDKRWAVVVGVGEYESEDIPDLEFAAADARSIKDFLESDAAGGFDVLFLENERATGAAMREALFVFLQQADWDDLVVIYFAGHGAPDSGRPDNLYLLPTDADLNALASTGFPMWDVKTALRRQIDSERVLVIADACHSAGAADGDTVGGGESNAIAGGFAQLFPGSRRLMMTAANTNEYAQEDERWGGHGVFTHFLLEGLRGAADQDNDGVVRFMELFDHVSNGVRQATNGQQNPQSSGFGDIPLAMVPQTQGGAGGG